MGGFWGSKGGPKGVWGPRARPLPTHRLLHHDGDEGGGTGRGRPVQAAPGAGPGPVQGALGGEGESVRPPGNREPPPETPRNRETPEIETPPKWDTPAPGLPLDRETAGTLPKTPGTLRDPPGTPPTPSAPSPPPPAPSRPGSVPRDPRSRDIAFPPATLPSKAPPPCGRGHRRHLTRLRTTLPIVLRGAAAMTPPEVELGAPLAPAAPPRTGTAPRWSRHSPVEHL